MRGVPQDSPCATLCCCRASANKPFRDGIHAAADFAASGEPALKASEPLMSRDGAVDVTPKLNGSLKVACNLEVASGTSRTNNRATQVFLCH